MRSGQCRSSTQEQQRLRKEEERWEGVALGIQWRKQESKFRGGGGEQWDGELEGMDGEEVDRKGKNCFLLKETDSLIEKTGDRARSLPPPHLLTAPRRQVGRHCTLSSEGKSEMALLPHWAAFDGLACWGPRPLRVLTFCM